MSDTFHATTWPPVGISNYCAITQLAVWLSLFTAFVINSAWKHETSFACADAKQLYWKVLSMYDKTKHILTSRPPPICMYIYIYCSHVHATWDLPDLDNLSQKLEQYNNYDNQVHSFLSSARASLL